MELKKCLTNLTYGYKKTKKKRWEFSLHSKLEGFGWNEKYVIPFYHQNSGLGYKDDFHAWRTLDMCQYDQTFQYS